MLSKKTQTGRTIKWKVNGLGGDDFEESSLWGRQENSLRTVRSNSQVLYTNTGWSVRNLRAGIVQVAGG